MLQRDRLQPGQKDQTFVGSELRGQLREVGLLWLAPGHATGLGTPSGGQATSEPTQSVIVYTNYLQQHSETMQYVSKESRTAVIVR